MNTVERCKKFAHAALALLDEKGETLEAVEWMYREAGKITDRLSDKTLKSCEYARGVLDIRVKANGPLYFLTSGDQRGWRDPERSMREGWDELRTILHELAGIKPI